MSHYETTEYLLEQRRPRVGNCVLWWARDGKGYTANVNAAHIFTKEEAERHAEQAGDLIPRLRSAVMLGATLMLDCQVLERVAEIQKHILEQSVQEVSAD